MIEFPGISWTLTLDAVPLAMQKVEGSSPFSRSRESPAQAGFFVTESRPGLLFAGAVSLQFAKRVADAAPGLDRVAERMQPRVRSALGGRPWLHDALDGTWLGVPLHPVLTDVPVGAWTA